MIGGFEIGDIIRVPVKGAPGLTEDRGEVINLFSRCPQNQAHGWLEYRSSLDEQLHSVCMPEVELEVRR